ncbi:LamG-like jellyroll fold domain-containing protein [Verrucomicrobiaceae bacterium 227]
MHTHFNNRTARNLTLGALALLSQAALGQGESLKTDLVSYWPLDVVEGNKTPDLASGYDFTLVNMDDGDLITGKFGSAFNFKKVDKAHLVRTHAANDDLPANKNTSFTIAFWTRTAGTGQRDLRLFSEGNGSTGTPLFTLGSDNTAAGSNSLDIYIRQPPSAESGHLKTAALPLDGLDWHHIAFVQDLQADGTSTRQVYIDGTLDTLVIPNKAADQIFDLNITSVGAVVRSSDVAHIDGDVDELVIWKRAITPGEITDLIANGMPNLDATQDDLAINSFTPEFRTVINGDEVKLSWDASKDATLSISPGIGDVTAISEFGVGSTTVTITEPTTFTLTASRGVETPLTQAITVNPISGVNPDWNWVEDFDDLLEGPLVKQGGWLGSEGSFEVQTIGDTNAIHQTANTDLTGRFLGTHAIAEGSSRTLFFRFCASSLDPDLPIELKVGLSEKAFRFATDWNENIGTYVIFSREAAGPLQLRAINGIDGSPIDSGVTLEPDSSYDVWIDITNNALGTTDKFSVYLAPSGGTRSLVFDNFDSDRKPGEVFLLGVPRANIDHAFAVSTTLAGQASQTVALDDFYVSPAGTFLSSAPVPSGFGKGPLGPPEILSYTFDGTDSLTMEWASRPGFLYGLWASPDLSDGSWVELVDEIVSGGASTSDTFNISGNGAKHFFQIRQQQ